MASKEKKEVTVRLPKVMRGGVFSSEDLDQIYKDNYYKTDGRVIATRQQLEEKKKRRQWRKVNANVACFIVLMLTSLSLTAQRLPDSVWIKISRADYAQFTDWQNQLPYAAMSGSGSQAYSLASDQVRASSLLSIVELVKTVGGLVGNFTSEKPAFQMKLVRANRIKTRNMMRYYRQYKRGRMPEDIYLFSIAEAKAINLKDER